MQKQTAFSRVISEHLVKILTFKIRNPTTHPRRRALSTVRQLCWYYTSKTELNTLHRGSQTYWLEGHICLSETLRGPQELIISIKRLEKYLING